jgi:hypothetical protein
MQWIAFDSHKRYTWALVQDERGEALQGLVGNMSHPDLIGRTAGPATYPQETQGAA